MCSDFGCHWAPHGRPSPHRGAEENGKKEAENRWVGIRAV